jgi:hypothetical protein
MSYKFEGKIEKYGKEIPLEERKRVFNECMEYIMSEAVEEEWFTEDSTYEPFLNEAAYSSRGNAGMVLGKESKKKLFATKAAVALAKANNDPMYKKLQKGIKLRKNMLAGINKKYGAASKKVAMEKIKECSKSSTVKYSSAVGGEKKKAKIKQPKRS